MKKNALLKSTLRYVFFFIFLCCYPYDIVLALPGPLINTLRTSPINDDSTKKECVKTKREKYLSSIRACKGIGSANTTSKVVALTFDDGPSKYTNEILKVLEENDIKATFFVLGENAKEYPNLVKKAYIQGHVIASHTYSHPYLPSLSPDKVEVELIKTNKLIYNLIGVYPGLFRPPYGACSNKSRIVVKNFGLKTILWSSISDDYHYNTITPAKIFFEIISLVRPGAIICLHDGGGPRQKTVEALKTIIIFLKNDGYEFLTVPELLGIPAYLGPTDEDTDE